MRLKKRHAGCDAIASWFGEQMRNPALGGASGGVASEMSRLDEAKLADAASSVKDAMNAKASPTASTPHPASIPGGTMCRGDPPRGSQPV